MTAGWFEETLYPALGQRLRMDRVLHRVRTAHQDLVVFENEALGRVLALDGVVQVVERDEHVYHEMLAHVPILAHGRARRVCVVGGGDGGILRRVLEHPGVERATLVEIDRGVVDLCREHMPMVGGDAFDDPRTELVIADGRAFMAADGPSFDVILVDSTDPVGPGAVLFEEAFYADCRRRLAPGGVLCTQNGVPFLQPDELRGTWERFGRVFRDRWFFLASVPTYYGGSMALGWGTDDPSLRRVPAETVRARADAAGLRARHHTPELHVAAFALPRSVLDLMGA